MLLFLSTPSARRATAQPCTSHLRFPISIHALREEGDLGDSRLLSGLFQFLSTPSARRATPLLKSSNFQPNDFYPRPPRGGRPFTSASRAGRINFYPRPPRGGRPARVHRRMRAHLISIHALREEGDHLSAENSDEAEIFLSTPSARRATTTTASDCTQATNFYPRPPRGGRPPSPLVQPTVQNFYPRPPRGGRPQPKLQPVTGFHISIHALREEGDPADRRKPEF